MKHSILSVAVFFAALGNAQALQTVGNGGDILKCMESPGKTEATYVLDELDFAYQPVATVDYFKMNQALQKALPRFYSEYVDFLSNWASYQNNMEPYLENVIWEKSEYLKLTELEDEVLPFAIPDHCKKYQAIYRVQPTGSEQVFLFHHSSLFNGSTLKEEQYSWILMHEFLWGKLPDAFSIRMVNQYFHSPDFVAAANEGDWPQIREFLKTWNLDSEVRRPCQLSISGTGPLYQVNFGIDSNSNAMLETEEFTEVKLKEENAKTMTFEFERPVPSGKGKIHFALAVIGEAKETMDVIVNCGEQTAVDILDMPTMFRGQSNMLTGVFAE